jgi:hypothetical protein
VTRNSLNIQVLWDVMLCLVVSCGVRTWLFFYIRGSVHGNSRLKKSNEMQSYANIYLLLNHSTCFERPSHLSSGVHKTVVAASGIDHTSSNVAEGHV